MKNLLALLFSVCLAASLEAKKPQLPSPCTPGPQSVSLTTNNWVESGAFFGRSKVPSALIGGGFFFDFPDYSTDRYIGYLTSGIPCGVAGSNYLTLTLNVVTTGTPVFMYDSEPGNTCVNPATARLYLEASHSSWTNADGDTFRWWSNPIAYTLMAGQATLTIPLTPDQWSTVYGRYGNADASTLAGFSESLQHTLTVGLTFGGGCFFGHGVNAQGGTAKFQLTDYRFTY